MKATLEFELPEERAEFDAASRGSEYLRALRDLDNWLRSKLKYEKKLTDAEQFTYQACRDQLRELCPGVWE